MKKQIYMLLLFPFFINAKSLIEGKTKRIESIDGKPADVLVVCKDAISSNDSELSDLINSKARLTNETSCNVFRLLKECGIPVAFHEQVDATKFRAPKCTMIPFNVVVRREAHGAYLKRNPHIQSGQYFPRLVIEFFLKTSDKKWGNYVLPIDNPFIQFRDGKAYLYHPEKPMYDQEPFLGLDDYPLKGRDDAIMKIIELSARTFLILEKSWQQSGSKLADCQLTFGVDQKRNLVLAEALDNDSWHIIHNSTALNTRHYQESLNAATKHYEYVRQCTSEFKLPKQQIVLWRESESDDISQFLKYVQPYVGTDLAVTLITRSLHKEPVQGFKNIMETVQNVPNSVVVAFVNRSNATGATLAAATLAPTITVPMGWKDFPNDVWSSLHTPNEVPLMTILDQNNAALAALQILAHSNPRVYAQLQMLRMNRLPNVLHM